MHEESWKSGMFLQSSWRHCLKLVKDTQAEEDDDQISGYAGQTLKTGREALIGQRAYTGQQGLPGEGGQGCADNEK
jgi:hypothetical protein